MPSSQKGRYNVYITRRGRNGHQSDDKIGDVNNPNNLLIRIKDCCKTSPSRASSTCQDITLDGLEKILHERISIHSSCGCEVCVEKLGDHSSCECQIDIPPFPTAVALVLKPACYRPGHDFDHIEVTCDSRWTTNASNENSLTAAEALRILLSAARLRRVTFMNSLDQFFWCHSQILDDHETTKSPTNPITSETYYDDMIHQYGFIEATKTIQSARFTENTHVDYTVMEWVSNLLSSSICLNELEFGCCKFGYEPRRFRVAKGTNQNTHRPRMSPRGLLALVCREIKAYAFKRNSTRSKPIISDGSDDMTTENRNDDKIMKSRIKVTKMEIMAQQMADGLAKNTSLRKINLKECGLSDSFLSTILNVDGCSNLQCLDLSGNACSNLTLTAIANLMVRHNQLKSLDLSNQRHREDDVLDLSLLANAFVVGRNDKNTSLNTLKLLGNCLVGFSQFMDALVSAKNESIHTLHVDRTLGDSLNDEEYCSLSSFLRTTQHLKVLYLLGSRLSADTFSMFAGAIGANTSLESLSLDFLLISQDQQEGKSAMREIGQMLAMNSTIRTLSLRGCNFNNNDLVVLGEYLPRMKGLERLDLRNNHLKEFESLAVAMAKNFSLISIQLTCRIFRGRDGRRVVDDNHFSTDKGKIDYYICLNKGGRRLLRSIEGGRPPLGLWPKVLERATLDAVYWIMQQDVLVV